MKILDSQESKSEIFVCFAPCALIDLSIGTLELPRWDYLKDDTRLEDCRPEVWLLSLAKYCCYYPRRVKTLP